MGATTFQDYSYGKTPEEAYERAVKQAQYDYGHRGYTGTIAEKSGFVVIECPIDDVNRFVEAVLDYGYDQVCKLDAKHLGVVREAHSIHDDKWGPALCIPLKEQNANGEKQFMFCGWASC